MKKSLETLPEVAGGLKRILVEASIELLTEPREVKLPTMREIAKRAGVAPGAAYRHFESQLALFLAVVASLFDRLENSLSKAAALEVSPGGVVRGLAHAYVRWGIENPGAYQLLLETTDNPDFLEQGERPGLHLIEQLAVLLADHSKTPTPKFEEATRTWVYLHGLISLRTHKTGMTWTTDVETEVNRFIDLMLSES